MEQVSFIEYYQAIDYDSKLITYKGYFDGYVLSESENELLINDLDHYQKIFRAIHVLQQQKLKISNPLLLDKLVERITEPEVGFNCFYIAEEYFGLDKTVTVLVDYLKRERYPDVLNRFFQTLLFMGTHYQAYKACYAIKYPDQKIYLEMSYEVAQKFIEVLFNIFIKEDKMDFFYSYNLSNLISIQKEGLPESLYPSIPKIKERSERLKLKTEIEFYDFMRHLVSNDYF